MSVMMTDFSKRSKGNINYLLEEKKINLSSIFRLSKTIVKDVQIILTVWLFKILFSEDRKRIFLLIPMSY